MPGLPSWRCHSHLEPLARNSTFLVFLFENTLICHILLNQSIKCGIMMYQNGFTFTIFPTLIPQTVQKSNTHSSKSHPFIFQHSMTSVRCGCGTLHNPFWVPYLTGVHWDTLGILHHSPIRDIYFSGDLKGLRQYRAGTAVPCW